VGSTTVIAACSGGVDSTVCAELARRAIGENLITVFLDDGMRREGEREGVVELLERMDLHVVAVEASERFYKALSGIQDAEEKRRAFRDAFYSTLAETAHALGAEFLIQGTIAADVVETVGGIKTQHNVLKQIGIDPSKYGFKVLEPLAELYKPQVRQVTLGLGLPREICESMPFPGPGLAIRVVGEVTPQRVRAVRAATRIVEEETSGMGAFQAFAVLIPARVTGLAGGKRTYGEVVAIRIVQSDDALTARVVDVPIAKLTRTATRIVQEVDGVGRCVYDVTDKPPATIEYE